MNKKKTSSIVCICVAMLLMIATPSKEIFAYDFSELQSIPIKDFYQEQDSIGNWFMWIPLNTETKKTYHELLEENFSSTLHELFIPFDIGLVQGSEYTDILGKYGLNEYSNIKIYRLDEVQQTFNSTYGTNIDLASLNGLMLGTIPIIMIRDNYFIITLLPHGTNAMHDANYGYKLNADSEYWNWRCTDGWNTPDPIYTIITNKNIAGYDIRAIEYISFTQPSDEFLNRYVQINSSPQYETVNVVLNGERIDFDQQPILYNNRVLVPMRKIFEAMECEVEWKESAKSICVYNYNDNHVREPIIYMQINNNMMWTSSSGDINLDISPMIINGKTFVPVRAISEALDSNVEWDGESQTVYIDYKEQQTQTDINEKFINKKINTEPQDIFWYDYDNDGYEEAFVFYKKKGYNGTYCDFFDFDDNNPKQTNIFRDKNFGATSFEFHSYDKGTVLEMVSDKSNVQLSYGFYVKDDEPTWQPAYGKVKSTLNMKYNWHMNTDKYIYNWGDERYHDNDTEKVPYLLPQIESFYWNMYLMEIDVDFLKTFKNGNEIYNDLIAEKENDKIQLLYSPDGTMYLNNKHYDDKNNRVDTTYIKLEVKSEKLVKTAYGKGNYIRGGLYPWLPYLYAADGDKAYDYECDTHDEYDDDSKWFENYEEKIQSDLWVYFDGNKLELTNQVQTVNDRTMYPFRECLEFMGAKVSWNSETNEAIAVLDNMTLVFKIGTNQYSVNEKIMNMDVNSYVDGTTGALYIPIRYAVEALGYEIKWIPGAKFTTISITQNDVQEIKDHSKELAKNKKAAELGKNLYKILERQGFYDIQKNMNETSMNLMSSVIETDKSSKNNKCILDVTHILLDGVEALAWTASGNIDKGIDYINDTVFGMASDAITGLIEPQTTDECIRAMCNAAFSDNMQLILKLNQYHYEYKEKMSDRQAEEYLTMYHEITMNNRTLKMGVEYFNEKITGGILNNTSVIVGDRFKKAAKSIIKDGFGIGADALTITDKIVYKSVEDFVETMFEDFEDSQSQALKSYAKDMKQLTKTYEGYLK